MSAFGLHHANITDNDLRYILWRSYKNLQGGGKHSILDKAEDIAMQYRLKAGNYADKFTNPKFCQLIFQLYLARPY